MLRFRKKIILWKVKKDCRKIIRKNRKMLKECQEASDKSRRNLRKLIKNL